MRVDPTAVPLTYWPTMVREAMGVLGQEAGVSKDGNPLGPVAPGLQSFVQRNKTAAGRQGQAQDQIGESVGQGRCGTANASTQNVLTVTAIEAAVDGGVAATNSDEAPRPSTSPSARRRQPRQTLGRTPQRPWQTRAEMARRAAPDAHRPMSCVSSFSFDRLR